MNTDFTPEACRIARAQQRLSQQALATRAGISRATLINFEAGKGKPLNASVAAIRAGLSGAGEAGTKPQSRLASVLRALQAAEHKFREKGVTRLAIFGSVARMEDGPNSDVDLVVDVDPARHLDIVDMVGIASMATDLLGIKTDVVRRRPKIKPALAANIAEEEIYAF